MRGGRNKFGPMYKRDRARKMQLARQRQMSMGFPVNSGTGMLHYPNQFNIGTINTSNANSKQELIQIPHLSSSTSSPDSSPQPGFNNPTQTVMNYTGNTKNNTDGMSSTDSMWGGGGGTATSNSSSVTPTTPTPGAAANNNNNNNNNTNNNNQGAVVKMPPLIRDLCAALDDGEWQHSVFTLLQSQTYNQCEVDLFELTCKVLDQNLFAQVDWARNSIYFKDLRVS